MMVKLVYAAGIYELTTDDIVIADGEGDDWASWNYGR